MKKNIDYTCPNCKKGQSRPDRVWCDECIDKKAKPTDYGQIALKALSRMKKD